MATFGMLWGANNPDDNQDVEHQSGASRLLGNICCAICGFPILLLISVILLGWNEKRAVCDAKAIAAGLEKVNEAECSAADAFDGELIMFQCDLSQTNCCSGGTLNDLKTSGEFGSTVSGYVGTGLDVKAEMYQCVETERSETKKDNVGGGKTTIKTYTYAMEWKSTWQDSSKFHKTNSQSFMTNCGSLNPQWPASVPVSKTYYAATAEAGDFTLPSKYVKMIPLETTWSDGSAPTDWTKNGGVYQTDKYVQSGHAHGAGRMRVTFKGTNWASPKVTVLGENKAGTVESWTAPDDWLCSGFTLTDLRSGSFTKEKLFEAMKAEAGGLTWVLRFLGWILAWVAFFLLAGPLEVAADCIPCIGPCLGDMISCIACCVACLPGTACAMFIIGIVWVAMRPMVGIPLVLICFIVFGGLVVFKLFFAKKKEEVAPLKYEDNPTENPSVVGKVYRGPVSEEVAQNFLNAAMDEYVNGVEGACGAFFDSAGGDAEPLNALEDRVRDAGDKQGEISAIRNEWGL